MDLGKSWKDVVQSEWNARHVRGCCFVSACFPTRPEPFAGLAETWLNILILLLKNVFHDVTSVFFLFRCCKNRRWERRRIPSLVVRLWFPLRWQWLLTTPGVACKALLASHHVGTCLSLPSWKMLFSSFKTRIHVLWGFERLLKLEALWIMLHSLNGEIHRCGGIVSSHCAVTQLAFLRNLFYIFAHVVFWMTP